MDLKATGNEAIEALCNWDPEELERILHDLEGRTEKCERSAPEMGEVQNAIASGAKEIRLFARVLETTRTNIDLIRKLWDGSIDRSEYSAKLPSGGLL